MEEWTTKFDDLKKVIGYAGIFQNADYIIVIGAFQFTDVITKCLEYFKEKIFIYDNAKVGSEINGVTVDSLDSLNKMKNKVSSKTIILHDNQQQRIARMPFSADNVALKATAAEVRDVLLLIKVINDVNIYIELNKDPNFVLVNDIVEFAPLDAFAKAGTQFNDTYLQQDLWGAKKVFENFPDVHYDIGSRVDGFVSHVLSFNTKLTLIDIRPLETYGTENITFINEDATMLLGIEDESITSLSALCSLEHFGLGRYGDPIDPDAHLKAFNSIQRVLKPGGNLFISLPVARSCQLIFHLHRIYTPQYVIEHLPQMDLIEFSLANDKGLTENVPIDDFAESGIGLFHFRKK